MTNPNNLGMTPDEERTDLLEELAMVQADARAELKRHRAQVADLERQLAETRTTIAAQEQDSAAETAGTFALRRECGARNEETFPGFVRRLAKDLAAAIARAETAEACCTGLEKERDVAYQKGFNEGHDKYLERHGSCPHKQARMKAEAACSNAVEREQAAQSRLAASEARCAELEAQAAACRRCSGRTASDCSGRCGSKAPSTEARCAELSAALRGLEYRDDPGRYCDHAAEPCPRCEAARTTLAAAGGTTDMEPTVCVDCGHAEIHHNSPIANGCCEGEFERCGCAKFAAPAPGKEDDRG